MPQLHFSVDDNTAAAVAEQAAARGLSVSRYLAIIVTQAVPSSWPKHYLRAIAGSCADTPLEEPADVPISAVEL